MDNIWILLVVLTDPSETYESQLGYVGILVPNIWKIKHVPNHPSEKAGVSEVNQLFEMAMASLGNCWFTRGYGDYGNTPQIAVGIRIMAVHHSIQEGPIFRQPS